jgi:hypothetical protein
MSNMLKEDDLALVSHQRYRPREDPIIYSPLENF